jgi:hypothetical protein
MVLILLLILLGPKLTGHTPPSSLVSDRFTRFFFAQKRKERSFIHSSPQPPSTGASVLCLPTAGLNGWILLHLPPFDWRPVALAEVPTGVEGQTLCTPDRRPRQPLAPPLPRRHSPQDRDFSWVPSSSTVEEGWLSLYRRKDRALPWFSSAGARTGPSHGSPPSASGAARRPQPLVPRYKVRVRRGQALMTNPHMPQHSRAGNEIH